MPLTCSEWPFLARNTMYTPKMLVFGQQLVEVYIYLK